MTGACALDEYYTTHLPARLNGQWLTVPQATVASCSRHVPPSHVSWPL